MGLQSIIYYYYYFFSLLLHVIRPTLFLILHFLNYLALQLSPK